MAIKKIHPPKPPKPVDRMQNMKTVRPNRDIAPQAPCIDYSVAGERPVALAKQRSHRNSVARRKPLTRLTR